MSAFDDVPPLNESDFPPGSTKERQQAKDGFPAIWVSDAVLKLDERPIVKGLIDPGAFVVIYGPPSSGKSFFGADIAQHIALGALWRGRRVSKGLVVYVASEAGASILKRFVAWRDNRLSEVSERLPLVVLTRGPSLIAGTDFEKLAAQLVALQLEAGLPLLLVVFDTLSRSMPGGDENNTEDMTMVISAADKLRDQFACATAFVHHSGKDPDKGARGHSSLVAAADVVIQIVPGIATVEKVRDGVAGERFGFHLEPVEIGIDSDGDPVRTCLFNALGEAPSATPKKVLIKGIAAMAIGALREVLEAQAQELPETSTIPKGARGVKIEQWRERFRLRYGDEHDAAARAKAFYRAKEALLGARAIAISDPWVWVCA